VTVLTGEYDGPLTTAEAAPALDPLVVFAGRMIPEKQAPAVVSAIAAARTRMPELRGMLIGDGPERDAVLRRVAELGLEGVVDVPGFVTSEEVQAALSRAMCLVLPSRREGYGQVVIEAAAHGTPSVVVAGPDNAAVELLSEGENGFIAPSAIATDLAAAVIRVSEGGSALRAATAAWFETNVERLSLEASLDVVADAYGLARSAAS
jgi:glycosyltransferase involved in cell wall biosynthesis